MVLTLTLALIAAMAVTTANAQEEAADAPAEEAFEEPIEADEPAVAPTEEAAEDTALAVESRYLARVEKLNLYDIAFKDNETLISVDNEGYIRAWNVATGAERWHLRDLDKSVRTLAVPSHDLSFIALGTVDGEIHMIYSDGSGVREGDWSGQPPWHTHQIRDLAFMPNSYILASTSPDRTIRIWDVEDPNNMQHLLTLKSSKTDWVNRVAWHPNRPNILAGASGDGTVRIWETRDGTPIATLQHPDRDAYVLTVAWHPAGDILVSGTVEGEIHIWDVGDHNNIAHVQALQRHTRAVRSLAFSPDGRTLASGDEDETYFWNANTLAFPLESIPTAIYFGGNRLAFSPNGRILASLDFRWSSGNIRRLESSDILLHEFVSPADGEGPAAFHIPDDNLANAIRRALKLDEGAPITAAAMRELTKLVAYNRGIADLTGLQHATQLETLYLNQNYSVSDVFPLAKLTNLKVLWLMNTKVEDISALAKLTNLQQLLLNGTDVSDISPLAKLTNLTALGLGNTKVKVEDISALAKLTNLSSLSLYGTNVSDIAVLAKLTNLTALYLHRTNVSDISALAKLTNLGDLQFSNTKVEDISALAKLTNLQRLLLSNTKVEDISALAKLTQLAGLGLTGTDVSDISPLAKLTQLEWLYLDDTDVSDISPLAKLTNLQKLYLTGSPLTHAAHSTHIPAMQAKGVTVVSDSPSRVCTSSIPENSAALQPVRIEPITRKKQIVSEGNFQGATVKFAPEVQGGQSRAWTPEQTVVGRKYGSNLGTLVITAKIRNGTAWSKRLIQKAAAEWSLHGNLFFRFVESGEADVTITINTQNESDSGWAHIGGSSSGTQMELGNDFSYGTCLHEFGHVLGLTHEHQSPRFLELVKWAYEGEELIAELRKDGIPHWSEEQIRRSILTRHEVGPAAKFDPDSIMTYDFSSKLFKARPNAPNPTLANEIATNGTQKNSELSADDKALLRHLYGNPSQKVKVLVDGSISIDGVDDESGVPTLKPIKVLGKTVAWRPGLKDDETINESKSFGPKLFTSIDEYVLTSDYPAATFKWGGECRVEVYLSTRKIVEDSHIEMAANVFLFEGTTENTNDLEDFKCVDFDIPLTSSNKKVTLELENKFWDDEPRTIDLRARTCRNINIDVERSTLSFKGDILGGGDWADVTISLSAQTIDNASLLLAAAEVAAAPAAATVKHRPSQALSDVNGDGQVTVADLMLVSNHIGQTTPSDSRVDLNADGIVTIVDLVQVAQHLGQSRDPAAPAHIVAPKGLAYETVEGWLNRARAADDGSQPFLQGITNLERLLLLIIPKKTALLHNYPNPFNPETWIPYHLAEPAEVTLTLYTADGKVVRTLALGHQPAGFYQSRSRAAYWDGRNEVGERVASGVYFYTLTAGDFAATRKMLIMK